MFIIPITIDNGVYKPTYNLGGPTLYNMGHGYPQTRWVFQLTKTYMPDFGVCHLSLSRSLSLFLSLSLQPIYIYTYIHIVRAPT